MNEYLGDLQNKSLMHDVEYLFTECKRRYLKAAALVGHFNDNVKKLDQGHEYSTKDLTRLVEVIYYRYNKDHCDDQLEILEPFEKMVERRWYNFIFKIRRALVQNDTFCRCCLRLAGYIPLDTTKNELSTAMQIVHEIDLRWYLSDEPMKTEEDEYGYYE